LVQWHYFLIVYRVFQGFPDIKNIDYFIIPTTQDMMPSSIEAYPFNKLPMCLNFEHSFFQTQIPKSQLSRPVAGGDSGHMSRRFGEDADAIGVARQIAHERLSENLVNFCPYNCSLVLTSLELEVNQKRDTFWNGWFSGFVDLLIFIMSDFVSLSKSFSVLEIVLIFGIAGFSFWI
jgi:hypothetical protein